MSNSNGLEGSLGAAVQPREQLERRAIEAVLTGTKWLSNREWLDEFGPQSDCTAAPVEHWVTAGRLFAIEWDGGRLLPRYAFDTTGAPLPVIHGVLSVFVGHSSWRVASWFESTSSLLGGARPRELVARDPEAVVAAAKSHNEGPMHG